MKPNYYWKDFLKKMMKKMKNKILNPNCSEQVFKLLGDLEEIKAEVLKMLDCWQQEQRDDGDNPLKKEIKELRERIKNIKDLKEFELVVFEFTCNYETYFKEDKGDLLVATCNNHDWDGVNHIQLSSDDYYSRIAKEDYYKLVFQEGNYVITKEEYGKGKLMFFEIGEDIQFEQDKTLKLIKRKGVLYISRNNQLVEIKEIKDENLKNKLLVLTNL